MIRKRVKNLPVLGPALKLCHDVYKSVRDEVRNLLLYAKSVNAIRLNKDLKNMEKGRRCFIIATGPSIKKMDLKPLAGELCISVSNFFVHPDWKLLNPKYHMFVQSHSPVTDEQWSTWLRDADRYFTKDQKVFLGMRDKYLIDTAHPFTNPDVRFYGLSLYKKIKRTVRYDRLVPDIQTSAQLAIYLAMYLGCTEIYLLGVDHDWILHYGESRHFYDEKQSVLMKAGYNEWSSDFGVQIKSYANLWKVYGNIASYAARHGIKIFNATPGSLLDIFPRTFLDGIVKGHS